jgi:hypothetical protein
MRGAFRGEQAMSNIHWIAYVVALIGAWIAYQQWCTARNKLKLDLFDRRMVVYECVREALGNAAREGNLSQEEQIAFLSGIQPAKWLFGAEVAIYLEKELWHKIVSLELHNTLSKNNPNEDQRIESIHLRAETMKWLMQQHKEFDELCKPYLTLTH